MTIKILSATYSTEGLTNKYGSELGTVDVQVGNAIHNLPAVKSKYSDDLSVAGFVGRYVTSNKPWLAHVSSRISAKGEEFTTAHFGRDERSGRNHKQSGISLEPATYATLCNPLYYVPGTPDEAPVVVKTKKVLPAGWTKVGRLEGMLKEKAMTVEDIAVAFAISNAAASALIGDLRRKGNTVTATKVDGVTTYRIG